MTQNQGLAPDLDAVLERNADDFATLRGARLFISGGTGFVGSWLLETFAWANRRLALDASAVVLTRKPDAFATAAPHLLCDPAISFRRGDVRATSSIWGTFDVAVHAATTVSSSFDSAYGQPPLELIETIVDGTRRVLELARRNGAIPFLFTSSGAVYGEQPPQLERIEETYLGGPDPLKTTRAYHEAKRLAEMLCGIEAERSGLETRIARLFAFVGPYLPVDRHFAIGNFIGDVLRSRAIGVFGDPRAVHTYMYAGDLATWLWRILARGQRQRAYNVGSEYPRAIADVARAVSEANNGVNEVIFRGAHGAQPFQPDRYVPSTLRARSELGLSETVPFDEAIRRTIAWHRARTTVRS
jgi:nucleoside-diphosphate-sugar epimerase